MSESNYREIEAKFLEIDVPNIIERLKELGAEDRGLKTLHEVVFYDKAGKWVNGERKIVRIRDIDGEITVSYKHQQEVSVMGMKEIEFKVDDKHLLKDFLTEIGLVANREQEKRRHTFQLDEVTVDIDTWPMLPPYIEIEGPSEEAIKHIATQLGLDWKDAVFERAKELFQKKYNISIDDYKIFTFDKVE